MEKETIHVERSSQFQKEKASKALEVAKAIEKNQLSNGAKYIRADRKTYILSK